VSNDVEAHLAKLPEPQRSTLVARTTLRFPVDRPLPLALVRRLVRVRLAQMGQGFGGVRLG
jgi:hypothetical protein